MDDNISLKIIDSFSKIEKINNDINYKLSNFIMNAKELVELSDGYYQIEKNLKLNKIFLKGFLLESSCCISLNNNNIIDYSLDELKNYLVKYEHDSGEDYSKYHLAVMLYKLIEDIEELVKLKVELEFKELSGIISNINEIKTIDKSNCDKFYVDIKSQLDNYIKNNDFDEKTYSICMQMINDIFNFYINGYPNIPSEYLYTSNDI